MGGPVMVISGGQSVSVLLAEQPAECSNMANDRVLIRRGED